LRKPANTSKSFVLPQTRAIYREAIDDGIVAMSPLARLKLPKV
jgi:hypothetical protein